MAAYTCELPKKSYRSHGTSECNCLCLNELERILAAKDKPKTPGRNPQFRLKPGEISGNFGQYRKPKNGRNVEVRSDRTLDVGEESWIESREEFCLHTGQKAPRTNDYSDTSQSIASSRVLNVGISRCEKLLIFS